MDFYQAIAQNYDHIFPFKPAQFDFIRAEARPSNRVCEIGYATGSLLVELVKSGYKIEGIELNPALRELALDKLLKSNIPYDKRLLKLADMRDLHRLNPIDSFDTILCLGNTLVHLSSDSEVEKFIISIYSLLKKGGKFILQIINYDRIFSAKLTGLPTIDNEHIRFERYYDYQDSNRFVGFRTKLLIKSSNQSLENNIPLLALRKSEIEVISRKSGFMEIKFYSNWHHAEWNNLAIPLICVLQK